MPTTSAVDELRRAFATRRLALFTDLGVPFESGQVSDRQGRSIPTLRRRGPGPTVVVVHGGLAEAGAWAPLLPHLPAQVDLVLVDRPGHGLGYPIDYRGLDYRAEASGFMAAVVDGLGLPRARIVANSMGGFFALAFALDQPDRVETLGLVGAPAGMETWLPPMIRVLATPGLNRLVQTITRGLGIEQLRKNVFHGQLVVDANRIPDAVLDVALVAAALPGAELAVRTMLQNVVSPLAGWRRPISAEVAALPCRTHFVWGDRDAFQSLEDARPFIDAMPQATVAVVKDAGHLPWLDHPRAVAAALAPVFAEPGGPGKPYGD